MGKYNWHVSVKGHKPKKIRHYNHITKMYQFILRNPVMFSGRMLTIYDHGKEITDITFAEIQSKDLYKLKETQVRSEILRRSHCEV